MIKGYGIRVEGSATQRNNVGLEVIGTDNSNFSNINSSNNYYGIYLMYSNSNNLANNTANSNRYIGINLYNSSSNNLTNNTAKYDISIGISIVNSDNNILTNNIGNSNGRFGFNIRSSNDNTLINNIADSNIGNGIRLNYSNMNIIIGNIANLNNESGINITSSNGNVIYNNYLNNFFNYHFDMISRNTWNTTKTPGTNIIGGPYVSGNFWASTNDTGFSQTCTDADRDGICDLPYVLDANNTDYLPLAAPDAPSIPSEIHGKVFNDINGDGIIDAGEAGISGVEIHLTRMISPGIEFLAGIISTDFNGNYSLTGIPSGYYRVEEFPVGSIQTYPANGMPQFITLGIGEIKNVENFGNQIILPGEIHGNTFNDSNGNGVQDIGESGMSGVNICLYPSWRCTTTDSSGNYSFTDVSPGTYNVYEYLPSGFVATTTTIVTIAVNSGEVIHDFRLFRFFNDPKSESNSFIS